MLDVPGVGRRRVEPRVLLEGEGGDESLGLPEHRQRELDAGGSQLRLDPEQLVVELVPKGHFFQIGPAEGLVGPSAHQCRLRDHRKGRRPWQHGELADLSDPSADPALQVVEVVVVPEPGFQAECRPIDVSGHILEVGGFDHPSNRRVDSQRDGGQLGGALGLVYGHVELSDLVLEQQVVGGLGRLFLGFAARGGRGRALGRGVGNRRQEQMAGVELEGRQERRLAAGGLHGRKSLAGILVAVVVVLVLAISIGFLGFVGGSSSRTRRGCHERRLECDALKGKLGPHHGRIDYITGAITGGIASVSSLGFFPCRSAAAAWRRTGTPDKRHPRLVSFREGFADAALSGAGFDPHKEARHVAIGAVATASSRRHFLLGPGGVQKDFHRVLVGRDSQMDLRGHADVLERIPFDAHGVWIPVKLFLDCCVYRFQFLAQCDETFSIRGLLFPFLLSSNDRCDSIRFDAIQWVSLVFPPGNYRVGC
mmetsp:Transcript_17313/g.47710  ORF Transcript_17313/g.47710 Transcript_17313/m.47710 type:complete len:480 (+) Transcript_17313:4894-6333(+)